jgi:antibiotic biosynthesis monooxygenase (ABM) superfamily enzyme
MIGRVWHGWTTPENADAYEELLRHEVFEGIKDRKIDGFREIQLLRRSLEKEVEFITIMWFDSLESVRAFAGEDYEVAVVPPKAQALLSRFDGRSQHHEVRAGLKPDSHPHEAPTPPERIGVEQRKHHPALRVLAALLALLAALVSLELLPATLIGAVASTESALERYLSLLAGIGLVALCAAGVKYAFHLRLRYWIVLLATLAALLLVDLAILASGFLD